MRHILLALTTLAHFVAPVVVSAQDRPAQPVIMQPDSDHPPCNIGLQVLKRGAKLRSGPGMGYPVIAILPPGTMVASCEAQNGWEGVVQGSPENCGLDITLSIARPYDGACPSGWIWAKRLKQVYG